MANEFQNKNRTSFEDMGRRVDEEVERMISYINDEVVPQVRNHSTRALRIAAEKLSQFADYVDERKAGKTSASTAEHDAHDPQI